MSNTNINKLSNTNINKLSIASIRKLLDYLAEVQHPLSSLSQFEKSRLSIQTIRKVFSYLSKCTPCWSTTKSFAQCVTKKIISLLLELSSDCNYFSVKLNLLSLELLNSISKLVQTATIAGILEFIDIKFVSDYLFCMYLIEDAKVNAMSLNILGSLIVSGKRISARLQLCNRLQLCTNTNYGLV